jgi:hypothetical protein
MPETTINGLGNSPTRTVTYSDIEIRNYYTYLPDARVAHNNTKPLGITSMALWIRGMYEPIAVTMFVRGAGGNANTPGFWVSRGNSANTETGLQPLYYQTNRATESAVIMGYTPYGPNPRYNACWFGNTNWGGGGQRINDDYEYPDNWVNRSLVGRYNYIQVPNAPAISSIFTSITRSSFSVRWSAPTDNGGSAITGYTVQVSTSSTFPSEGRISYTTTTTSQVVTGLTSGTKYYVRVLASNKLSAIGSSQWSSVVDVTTVVDPPVWQDKALPNTMRADTSYSDYLYAPSFDNSQRYRVKDGSSLPTGITLTNYKSVAGDGLVTGMWYGKVSGSAAASQVGTKNFTIEAYNDGGVISQAFTLQIIPQNSEWTDVVLNDLFRLRFPYKSISGGIESVSASGTNLVYSVNTGSLPSGISLGSSSGEITGTPTAQGTYTFGIRGTNQSGGHPSPDPVPYTRIVRPSATRYDQVLDTQNVSTIKRWNGTEWEDISLTKRYDGSSWVSTT